MPEVTESIDISKPMAEVIAFVEDPTKTTLWQSNMIEYDKLDEGPVDKGTRYRGTSRVAGRSIGWEAEVVEREEDGSRILLRSTGGALE